MNKKQSMILAVAAIVVTACVVAGLKIKPAAAPVAMAKAVVAVQDVPEGKSIVLSAVETKEVPADQVKPDTFTSAILVAGRIAKHAIKKGQVLSKEDIAAFEFAN